MEAWLRAESIRARLGLFINIKKIVENQPGPVDDGYQDFYGCADAHSAREIARRVISDMCIKDSDIEDKDRRKMFIFLSYARKWRPGPDVTPALERVILKRFLAVCRKLLCTPPEQAHDRKDTLLQLLYHTK